MDNNKFTPFTLTTVCREDLESIGFDTKNIDDETMQELASKMGEAIMAEFWIDLPIIAEHLKIPKKEENENSGVLSILEVG